MTTSSRNPSPASERTIAALSEELKLPEKIIRDVASDLGAGEQLLSTSQKYALHIRKVRTIAKAIGWDCTWRKPTLWARDWRISEAEVLKLDRAGISYRIIGERAGVTRQAIHAYLAKKRPGVSKGYQSRKP